MEIVLTKKSNIWSLFQNMLPLSKSKKKKFTNSDYKIIKNQINLSINKIQKQKCKRELKYSSIFDFLKVKSEFVGEAECCLYTLLGIFQIYPTEVPYVRKSSLLKAQKNIFMKDRRESVEEDLAFKDEKIITFLSDDQIKILIKILSLIEQEKFEENKVGIMILFGFYNDKELTLRTQTKEIESSIEPMSSSKEINWENLTPEDSLTFLLDDITKFQKSKVFQFLGLNHLEIKHFLIKLSIEQWAHFNFISEKIKYMFASMKVYFFQYLVYLMFSRRIEFVHKFLIIAALKSKIN
jgi:hypothetical protein